MNYDTDVLEQQFVDTLKVDALLSQAKVRSHAGEISPRLFMDPEYLDGFIPQLPCALVRYVGRVKVDGDDDAQQEEFDLYYSIFVASGSSRSKSEEARPYAYDMLAAVYDALHGHWFNSVQTLAASTPRLGGTQIADTNFVETSPIMPAEGRDEQVVVDMPQILGYEAKYKVRVLG